MNTSQATMYSLKTNKQVKNLAQLRAKQLGIPLGTIVNAFLRSFGQTGVVHFEVSEPVTPKLRKIIETIEAEIAHGDTYGPFDSKEAIDFLNDNSPSSLGFDSDER